MSPNRRICFLALLLVAAAAGSRLAAGERIVFSGNGGDAGPADSAKIDPRRALPWSSANSIPGQRIVFSTRVDALSGPESPRRESLLAPSFDLVKSSASMVNLDVPLMQAPAGMAGNGSGSEVRAPLTKQQQKVLDARQGWIYDNKTSGGAEENIQNPGEKVDQSKSGMERFLEARAQNHRDAATNSFGGGSGIGPLLNPAGSSGWRPGLDGHRQNSVSDAIAGVDGLVDFSSRLYGADAAAGLGGEKTFLHVGPDFHERFREHQADLDQFKKLFEPVPIALPPSSFQADFSHRFDAGLNGNAFSSRNFGGAGAGGSLFDSGLRSSGIPGMQSSPLSDPNPVRPKPVPSSFDLPRIGF